MRLPQVKCDIYWPLIIGTQKVYDNVTVTTLSCDTYADYIIRTFRITCQVINMEAAIPINRGDSGSIPPATISKLRQFRSPHIACFFLRDTTSQWSLLSGVYPGKSKIPYRGKCVTCSRLSNSREGQLWKLPFMTIMAINGRKRIYHYTVFSHCIISQL